MKNITVTVVVGLAAGVVGSSLRRVVRERVDRRRQRIFYAGYRAGVEDVTAAEYRTPASV